MMGADGCRLRSKVDTGEVLQEEDGDDGGGEGDGDVVTNVAEDSCSDNIVVS
jgi:hypothetical protein